MEPESEAVRDGLRTLEHQNLPKLIEMLLHIEGLRGRGWLFDEIAAEMTEGPFDPPVGGAWSGPMVAEILGVIDTVREEEDQAAPTPTHTPTSIPAAQPQTPTATPTPTMLSTPSVAPTPTPTQTPTPNPAPVAPAGRTAPLPQLSERRETTTPRGPIIEPRTAAYYQEPRALPELGPETRIPRWPFAALCLLVIGAGVVYLLLNAGSNGDADSAASNVEAEGEEPLAAAAAEDDQQNSIDQTPADEQVGGSAEELAETLSPPEESDPADMMSIRVEPEAPEVIDPATGLPIQPATATVRADGLLHLDGAFPTQADADRYVAGMAEVFGEDNIVENYQINPAAPLPASADVSLDKPVLFASGTAEIDPSYYPFLEACGDVMKLNPQITMSIAAFTDSTGSEELNLELSQRRANAIYQFYLDYDLSQEQLQPLAFGEAEPVADNTTEAGRQENRRAMLRLLDVLATESADDE